jgi:acyl dehydratase
MDKLIMGLSSRLVGMPFKDLVREVTWRETMNYAASVEDNNPLYFDDERDDGIIAPPMFAVAVTFPVIERIWDFVDGGDFPLEIMPTMVHHTEHIRFARTIRPDEVLTVKGRVAAIVPHRAGTTIVIRFDVSDSMGKEVFCEHIGALMRGIQCDDGGGGEDALPKAPSFDRDEEEIWESRIKIDPFRPFIYDGCSRIFFPIHTSRSFARQVGLPGIILQGTATLAYAVREITNREADADPTRLRAVSCRFSGMVMPATEITVRITGKNYSEKGTDLFFSVFNEEGRIAVGNGHVLIAVD